MLALVGQPRPGGAPPRLGARAIGNLLRMGHCAPTLVRTLLEAKGACAPHLVALTAALPGMASTGNECGGISGPLVVLGLRHARDPALDGVPAPVVLGRALLDAFRADHGTTRCRDILGDARLPLRCFGVVGRAPGRCGAVESGGRRPVVPPGRQEAHAAFCAYLEGCGFHCARAVLRASADLGAARPEHLDAASAFVGGTALAGLTCSALAGGLLLLGHHLGAVENSRLRVLRQVATMAVRGDAFADDRNAFNRALNRGHDLAHWFAGRFGGTGCRELTGCDLDTLDGVRTYVEGDTVAHCAEVAREVAAAAEAIVRHGAGGRRASDT